MKKIMLLLSVLLLSLSASADFAGEICEHGPYASVLTSSSRMACYGFVDGDRAVLFDEPISGRVISSSDGSTVIALSTWLPTHVAGRDPLVIQVFKAGKRTHAYRLSEVVDQKDLQHSISHASWIEGWPDVVRRRMLLELTKGKKRILSSTGELSGLVP